MSEKQPRKPRVVTEATKAKLPRPKRKRPEGSAPKRVQCPRCEKLVPSGPHDIHTCYDAKALREAGLTPSPIAGQPLDGVGSAPAPDFRVIPCGGDVTPMHSSLRTYLAEEFRKHPLMHEPWPVRVLNWLDDAPTKARRTIAAWLRALAGKVDV